MATKQAPRVPRTRARTIDPDQALLDALENAISSAATAGHIEALRSRGFSEGYVIASLLAGAKSLLRGMPTKQPWSALLEGMASEVRNG
ncbi:MULTISPECIES: hypothetical protein [unclassified Mesorhizobium]|uniref:hypothetical protein n=1 Tax=unclassified Mesorhizobium TaxID=325217 RepID=UPI001CCB7479|nr:MULTISPECIES: hypothetical protein [unclassified Mesorhizobium]MBZ9741021.1 hypothetical protein [Mesorhizobium sp. CO1-1-4]MBZ9804370.1 hypothetical protein [Mesorhizobium sp. ES1-6]